MRALASPNNVVCKMIDCKDKEGKASADSKGCEETIQVYTFENLTWSYTCGPEQNSPETNYPPEHEIRRYISIE